MALNSCLKLGKDRKERLAKRKEAESKVVYASRWRDDLL
jgi:hypothetical protein